MPIIGRADIDIRALTDKFRGDIQKAVKGIKDVGIDIKVSADISDAQDKIKDLKRKTEVSPVEVNVKADTKKLEDSLKKSTEKVRPVKVAVSANVTEFKKSVRELNESVKDMKVKVPVFAAPKFFKRDVDAFVRNTTFNPVKLNLVVDTAEAQRVIDDLRAQIDAQIPLTLNTTPALQQATATSAAISSMNPTMTANANTAVAAAQLAYLARTRRVPFTVKLERDALRALGGLLETLTGILPEKEIRQAIVNVTSNFSSLILKAGQTAAVMGALGVAGVSAFGGILAAGNDVARIVGIMATLPAVMTTGYLAMKTWTGAWKDFGAAAAGSDDALKLLTPSARAAAKAMSLVVEKIQPRVQETFWQQAGNEMIAFAEVVMPSVSNAMNDMALNMGNGMDAVLDSFLNFGVESSDGVTYLNRTLDNLGTSVAYITDAMHPLANSFITLAEIGSTYMPAFGKAIRDVARDFNDFIQLAGRTGEIDRWILSGVSSIKALASVVASTTTIFGNMADAAERAGYGGIHSLAESLGRLAKASGDALVMERMTELFSGAARGAEELSTGLGFIATTVGRAVPRISELLTLLGEIGRIGFENLNALLNAEGLGDGIQTALEGFKIGLEEVKPGFAAIGEAIGHIATIAGTMFQTMAPGFNNLSILIRDVVEGLSGGLTAAMPVVNHFVDMWMQILRLPIAALADGIGALLTVFAKMPPFIQNTILSIVALTTAMKLLGVVAASASFGRLLGAFSAVRASAATTATAMTTAFASGGIRGGIGAIAGSVGKLALKFTGIGTAIAVIDGLMTAYNESFGAAEVATVNLTTAVEQYGSSSEEAFEATKSALETSKTFGQAVGDQIITLGGLLDGTNRAADGFRDLGWDIDEVSAAVQKSGGEWTGYRHQLEGLIEGTSEVTDTTDDFQRITKEASIAILGNDSAAGMHINTVKEMRNSYDVTNRAVEESSAAQEKAAEAARKSAEFNKQVADAVGNIAPKLSAAADGYKVLGDASSSASDKLSALQDTMAYVQSSYDMAGNAIKNSTTATQADTQAKMSNAAATDEINAAIGQLSVQYGAVGTSILNAKGELDELNPVARGVFDNLSNISQSIQEVGINTYDAALKGGASIQQATDKAMGSMEPMIENVKSQLRAMGITGDEAINTILRQVGLLPSDLEMSINASGNAAKVAMETKLIVEGLVAGNYDIALGAVDKNALATIAEVHGAGQAFEEDDFEAVFKAIAEDIGVAEAAQFLQDTAGMDYEAIMNLYAENYASEEVNKALADAGKLEGTEFSATLTAINEIEGPVRESIAKLQDLDDFDPKVKLDIITNQFDQGTREALAKALELENADPETILSALDNASPTVLEALGLSEQFDGQVSEAFLKVIDEASPEAIKAYDELKKVDGSTWEARIKAVNDIPDEVQVALGEMLKVDGMDAEAVLHALDNASPVVAEAVREILKVNEANAKGSVDVEDKASDKAKNAGLNIEAGAVHSEGSVSVRGTEEVVTKAQNAKTAIEGVNGVTGQGALSVAGTEDVHAKTQSAGTAVTGFGLFNASATLSATDLATDKIAPINTSLDEAAAKNPNPEINLGGSPAQVRDDLAHIQRKLDDIGNKNPSPTVTMQGGPATISTLSNIVSKTSALSTMTATPRVQLSGSEAAQSQLHGLVSRVSSLSSMTAFPRISLSGAEAALGQVSTVIARVQALGATVGQPRVILQGAPAAMSLIATVLARLNNLGGSTANPRIVLHGGPAAIAGVRSVQSTFDRLDRSVATPRIDLQGNSRANSQLATVQGNVDRLSRTTATPNINLTGSSNANSEINSVRNNLVSLDGKVSTVTIRTVRTGENAHGGIYNSQGATAFANGGIMKGIESFANGGLKMPNMKSFASGSENHVAQIAQGKWPVRVWAEPETGGEAYIPLHVNKRKRSLDILNQVAEMFGFSLVKKFADGGILNSISAQNGGQFADGGFHASKNISGYVAGTSARNGGVTEVANVGGTGDSVVINNHVYPSAQLDEQQVADSVSRDLFWKLMNN